MLNKIKSFLNAKKISAVLAVSAAVPVMAVAASAESTEATAGIVETAVTSTTDALTTQLTAALPSLLGGLVSIGMFGISIYAAIGLFKLAKSAFAKIGGK